MQLRYGGVFFPANAAVITTRKETTRAPTGDPYGELVVVDVQATLLGSGQADIAQQCDLLERTMRLPGRDLVFVRDDGGIAMALLDGPSVSGVVITRGPAYPVGAGGFEFVSGRTVSFTAEAEYDYAPGAPVLLDYAETLRFWGGGFRDGHIQPANARPIKTRIFQATPYKASQSGSAVGLNTYPFPASPLFPDARVEGGPDVAYRTPKRRGKLFRGWGVEWKYEYESADPLGGLPTLPVG